MELLIFLVFAVALGGFVYWRISTKAARRVAREAEKPPLTRPSRVITTEPEGE